MTGSHVGTGETRRYVVLCSGRSLLRFLVLDQEIVRAFAPGLCTEKRGLFLLVNSSLSLIGAGVALVAKRPVASRQAVGRMAGRAGQVARVIRPLARTALLLPGRAKSMLNPFSRRHSASSHLASHSRSSFSSAMIGTASCGSGKNRVHTRSSQKLRPT